MRLRYAGVCRVCAIELAAKAEAIHERATKTVRCLGHEISPGMSNKSEPSVVQVVNDAPESRPDVVVTEALAAPELVDSGVAGASARREFERRKAKRAEGIRTKHPKLGGLILAGDR